MYADRLHMAQAVFRNGAGPFVIHVKTQEFADQHNQFIMVPSGDDAAVHIVELSKRFDGVTVLDRLSLTVPRGAIFGLLGPNGAGKSTTIKILTTLLDATAGSAKVGGWDVARDAVKVRQCIGYVPQMLSADGALTGKENLDLSARLYGLRGALRRSRVCEALTFAGLEDVAANLVRTYSGGMIRRLEIAQATLHYPAVLFLDEPTIGLDPVARRTVWERLQGLRQSRGMTILLTTHDMEEADILCDELAILHRGQLAVVGRPRELKEKLGPDATLEDVFIRFSGVSMEEGGNYRDVRTARGAIQRLG
jgi:ABC-2 type transport system ATP-binding protein